MSPSTNLCYKWVLCTVAGPKCWNKLPVGLRDLSVGPETFAKTLENTLVQSWFF